MTSREIRQSFLDYFARHGHTIVPSSSLVPAGDTTLLFTNAGMNQFKDLFLGRETREYTRATTCQKVMRVSGKHNDLDTVGPSLTHHTFFQMLGNFSFGDYTKQEAIPLAWELLTGVWKLPADRLRPSIFKGETGIPRDDEAFDIWRKFVPEDRILEYGLDDNFWQMGDTGPCGRCSEIYYVGDAGRPDVEIWNNVFMEFERDASGALTPLPAPSIDTGMGLERITAVIQGKASNYDTDLFLPILEAIGLRAGRPYTGAADPADHPDVSMRVVADHLRAMTFLIADGVQPSNEWRGYVLRKIMRRAMRHGKKLGLTKPFLHELAEVVISRMAHAYPELKTEHDHVVRTIRAEEDRFDTVLTSGLPKLEDLIERTRAAGVKVLPGDEVFRLYDSLGVPLDFAEDLAGQRGLTIDRAAYDAAMEGQRERARAGSKFGASAPGTPAADTAGSRTPAAPELGAARDVFTGYTTLVEPAAKVLAVQPGPAADERFVYLDRTPFYLRSGGQVSDVGLLTTPEGLRAEVIGVERPDAGKPRAHHVRLVSGHLNAGDVVTAAVDADVRDATRRNHTATHLLHAALRQRLGSYVRQAGSLVAPDRLRFDFTHTQALTDDDRRQVERVVNEQIYRNTTVTTEEKRTEDAIKAGAMALFGEKYGDTVRVVSVAGFSLELCGGTHVRATGDIGPFVITEESGVAAGVRRIEALTGRGAVEHIQAREAALDRTLETLGVPSDQAVDAIAKLQAEAKRLARENEQLKMKVALGGGGPDRADDDTVTVGDARFVARRVTGLEKGALRGLSDSLRDRLKRGVVVLAAESDGKVQLLVSVTKDLTDRVKAGQLVKELAPIVGGGGGGRPDFAEAGGRDAARIDELLARARELLTDALA